MERFTIGDVVITPFPYSNFKSAKLRPALVLAKAEFGDVILCQITSKPYSSKIAIKLTQPDFTKGSLPLTSYIRPDKLFTAETNLIRSIYGKINAKKKRSVLNAVQKLFKP